MKEVRCKMRKGKEKGVKPAGNMSRRDFLGGATAAAAFTIVPRHVLGGQGNKPPSEKLNVAGVGVGGMGKANIRNLQDENIVALCDVDADYAKRVFLQFSNAKKWTDYRKMLDKQKDIDAVVIATADHTHAVVAIDAMRRGKHVYCQKPLTHSVYEARVLTEAAKKYKVATQMGNQGHSGDGIRMVKEWIDDGAIGPVREVWCWTDRPKGYWPQPADKPQSTPSVPDSIDWDLWIGPAPYRDYSQVYHPRVWRGWWDYGTGALGDMGCHIIDVPFYALELGYPKTVQASFTQLTRHFDKTMEYTGPASSVIYYEFPARGDKPAVKLSWWDGGLKPPRPDDLEGGRRMGDPGGGTMFIGDKGKIMCGLYGTGPRIIPETKMKQYKLPPESIPRIPDGASGHEKDWARACKGGRPASSNFEYAGPLTETVLLGNLALRCPDARNNILQWDGKNMKVTNVASANEYVRRDYRKGWELKI